MAGTVSRVAVGRWGRALAGRAPIVGRFVRDRRVRYLFAGGVAYLLYNATFTLGWLGSQGRIPYLLLAVISNAVTALACYPVYRWAFGWRGPWVAGFLRFYPICLWSLGVVLVALPFMIEVLGWPVLVSQVISLTVAPVITYQLFRFWAFRHHPVAGAVEPVAESASQS